MQVQLRAALLVGDGNKLSMRGYWDTHRQSEICSMTTLQKHRGLVELWHQTISLMREALLGEHDFLSSGSDWESRNLRSRFEVVALSTSKCVLDCAVGGMYVQGLALTRHLFETWQRIAYARLFPDSARNWLSHNGRAPTPPSQNTITNGLRKYYLPATVPTYVEARIRENDLMAHPSYATITAHDTEDETFLKIAPAYDNKLATRLISNALIASKLILLEMPNNLSLESNWKSQAEDLSVKVDEEIRILFSNFPEQSQSAGPE